VATHININICGHILFNLLYFHFTHTHFCCHFFSGGKKIIETWSYNFFVTTRVKINVGKEACKEWLKSFACNTSCQTRACILYTCNIKQIFFLFFLFLLHYYFNINREKKGADTTCEASCSTCMTKSPFLGVHLYVM
jgi:hypothetical protein